MEKKRHELIEATEHGEFDLVITTLSVDDTLFDSELLFVEENVIAASEPLPCRNLERRRFSVINAGSLNHLSFAMLNEDHLMQKELNELIRANNLTLRREVECTSLETLVEMVREGIGYAFIPACLAKGNLCFYSIAEAAPKRGIVVMYQKGQLLSRVVTDLKKIMHEVLG